MNNLPPGPWNLPPGVTLRDIDPPNRCDDCGRLLVNGRCPNRCWDEDEPTWEEKYGGET